MRLGRRPLALFLICLPVLGLSVLLLAPAGQTWLELTDAETGRRIISQPLQSGEEVVLTWKNSLFGLQVTEVFVAADGILLLTQITFADPRGGEVYFVLGNGGRDASIAPCSSQAGQRPIAVHALAILWRSNGRRQ